MREFLRNARRWTARLRDKAERRDVEAMAEVSSELDELEARARRLANEIRQGGLSGPARESALDELSELRRAAHVTAALAQSEVLYLRFCRQSTVPAREYTASGEAAPETRLTSGWEA